MAASWIATLVWSVALAASTSWAGLTRSLRSHYDYAAALPAVRRAGLGDYVRTYVTQLATTRDPREEPPARDAGRPSGASRSSGCPVSGWAAVGRSSLVAATVPLCRRRRSTVRRLGSDAAGPRRRAVPRLRAVDAARRHCGRRRLRRARRGAFAVLAIAATAAGRWTAPGARADRRRRSSPTLALLQLRPRAAGSSALSIAVLLSTRRHALLWPAVIGGAAVAAIWTLAGFGWFDGFNAARGLYAPAPRPRRPYSYFVVANLVVFAVMLGPAVIAALTLRWRSEAGRGWSGGDRASFPRPLRSAAALVGGGVTRRRRRRRSLGTLEG